VFNGLKLQGVAMPACLLQRLADQNRMEDLTPTLVANAALRDADADEPSNAGAQPVSKVTGNRVVLLAEHVCRVFKMSRLCA
jgi:hypothetical protein